MPTVTLMFRLPDEQADFDAARTGADARLALWQIDRRLREVVKYGEPSIEALRLAEEIRGMIPPELLASQY